MDCTDEFRIQAVVPEYDLSPDCTDAPICVDGNDNDGDGRVDFPDDPGCASFSDASERGGTLVCDDGVDNDGDGELDYPGSSGDPGCDSLEDADERGSLVCDNTVDEDSDGLADYPADGGCTSARDRSEYGGACADDAFEENDVSSISPFGGSPANIPFGQTHSLMLCPDDGDAFNAGFFGVDLDITFNFDDSAANLDLRVYRSTFCSGPFGIPFQCSLPFALISDPTGATPTSIDLSDTNGPYRIAVTGGTIDDSAPYELRID